MGSCGSHTRARKNLKFVVSPSGGDYRTLADAVANSPAGARITVKPGTYDEKRDVHIDKPLNITGTDGATINGNIVINLSSDVGKTERVVIETLALTCSRSIPAVHITSGQAMLVSCTISGGKDGLAVQGRNGFPVLHACSIVSAERASVVFSDHAQGQLHHCILSGSATGIIIESESEPLFFNCSITHCGTGMHARESAKGYFTNCTFEHNNKPGVLVTTRANPVLDHCSIGAGESNGIFVRDEGMGIFTVCEIWGNALPGVATCTGGDPIVSGCIVRDGRNAGILVYDSGRGVVNGCMVRQNIMPGVEVRAGGNPVINSCSIFKGDSNGVYVHNRGCGLFNSCSIYENVLPGVAVRTSGMPILVGSKLTTGKDNAVLICDRGRGAFIQCELIGYSTRPMEVRDGCTPFLHECVTHDGKHATVLQWLEQIPLHSMTDPDPFQPYTGSSFIPTPSNLGLSGGDTILSSKVEIGVGPAPWAASDSGGVGPNGATVSTGVGLPPGSNCNIVELNVDASATTKQATPHQPTPESHPTDTQDEPSPEHPTTTEAPLCLTTTKQPAERRSSIASLSEEFENQGI
ncbi:AAA family ATPase [Pelomyxa schiedti]|nr:AAA family ATPase [Pelomyxa schiedti]